MDWIQSAIREFGTLIGIDELRPSPAGSLQLEIGNHTRVAIEPTPEHDAHEVLVSMSRGLEQDTPSTAQRALRRAFFHQSPGLFVQVAVTDFGGETRLLAVTRLPARSCTAQTLFQAVNALYHWVDATLSPGAGHA